MLVIFSTPVLTRHLWKLKTIVFQHYCLISAVLFDWFYFVPHHPSRPRHVQLWLSRVTVFGIFTLMIAINFANVNTALARVYSLDLYELTVWKIELLPFTPDTKNCLIFEFECNFKFKFWWETTPSKLWTHYFQKYTFYDIAFKFSLN